MHQAMHAARLAQIQGAVLGLLRDASEEEDGFQKPDGLTITATVDADHTVFIDLQWMVGTVPVAGESL